MYSCSEPLTPPLSIHAAAPAVPDGGGSSNRAPVPKSILTEPPGHPLSQCPAIVHGEGLLHDARNLMGALGLYCDLLSMPGVLKPEHRHYAEEVRLLGARSTAMIQQLMEHPATSADRFDGSACSWLNPSTKPAQVVPHTWMQSRPAGVGPGNGSESATSPASLRSVVERCSGVLGRVAGGRAIEINYGAAASVPVRVGEEAVERILVNLVRNAAAALSKSAPAHPPEHNAGGNSPEDVERSAGTDSVCERPANPTANQTPGAIRIGVGLLVNRVGDPRPWPFRRVRLTVEDSGCGMAAEQLERLLSGSRAPSRGSHGIGFRVVRELIAASDGDLRVMSAPGIGTWVQIEWPMVAASMTETADGPGAFRAGTERRLSC
jgi:signal transduction histidine kinase